MPSSALPLKANRILLCLLVAHLVGACTLGGDSDPQGGECASLAGTWKVNETTDASACGGGSRQRDTTWVITQQGCALTIAADKQTFSATATADQILINGVFLQDEGQASIQNQQLQAGNGTLSGTYTWTYTAQGASCQGSTTVVGARTTSGTGGSGGSGAAGSSGGQGVLGADEKALIGTWFRDLGYGGEEFFYVFDGDRSGCKWEEPPQSSKREKAATFTSWRLVPRPPASDGRFDVLVKTTGQEYSAGIFDRSKDRFYQGGYSSLGMTRVQGGKVCE